MEKQEEVKNHPSKWENDKFLKQLNSVEQTIARLLIKKEGIIEEQKVLLTTDTLLHNLTV